jgi:hypothetical protein
MPNKNRDRLNQPPTGQGKKQSPRSGAENKLHKRSEVLQATGVKENIGSPEDEDAVRGPAGKNPKRPKAGR